VAVDALKKEVKYQKPFAVFEKLRTEQLTLLQ
jgi:hypothetical protein